MRINDAILRPAANNLTLTRLILASSVIYTHSAKHFLHVDSDDLAWLLGWPVSHYGVDGFFILSGFLVYRSLVQNGSLTRFVRARLTRLVPGLALMLLLLIVAGTAATSLPLAQYLTGRETLKFFFYNVSLIAPAYTLSGVSCGPGRCVVNESLWTLPWEARCYAALVLLSLFGLARKRRMVEMVIPLTFAGAVAWSVFASDPQRLADIGPSLSYFASTTSRLWTAFALGILCYEIRDRITLSWLGLALLFGANVLIQRYLPMFGIPARTLFCGYLVLCLGFLSARKGAVSGTWPDYSYGMYIYGFPVMLGLTSLVTLPGPHALAAATVVLTLPFAAMSWHLVEKPALDWLRRHQRTAYRAKTELSDEAPGTT